jgi:hypothetical protein
MTPAKYIEFYAGVPFQKPHGFGTVSLDAPDDARGKEHIRRVSLTERVISVLFFGQIYIGHPDMGRPIA